MDNRFDQEEVDPDIAWEIVENIVSEKTLDIFTEEDYATEDESEIDWENL